MLELILSEPAVQIGLGEHPIARKRPSPDESDALGYVGHGMIPIIFIFDRYVAFESLALQFAQDALYVRNASAKNGIGQRFADLGSFFEVATDNAPVQNLEGIQRFDVGGCPMAGISAGPNTGIAILDDRKDIVGVPDLVARVIGAASVLMNADGNIELFDQLLNNIEVLHGFGGDAVKSEFLGELKNFAPFGLILSADHAIIDS